MQPAGVGIGMKPPVYLKGGDVVSISVNGLGTLVNRVADPRLDKPKVEQVESIAYMQPIHVVDPYKPSPLKMINGKPLFYLGLGDSRSTTAPIVLLHGLGGSNNYFDPLVHALKLERHAIHAFDFEGHGLSPTSPLSKISIESLANDLNGVFEYAKITSSAIIIAHGMSCLVAMNFALAHPELVSKLVLLGPPPSPLPDIDCLNVSSEAYTARRDGMLAISKMVPMTGTSRKTKDTNQLAIAAIKISLLGQDAEGYTKAGLALVDAREIDVGAIKAKTLIVTGSEDEVSPPQTCEDYVNRMEDARFRVLQDVGHWHVFEDCSSVANAVQEFLGDD
jgi:pimeloyl-ACP methyl ester carboxylesterase